MQGGGPLLTAQQARAVYKGAPIAKRFKSKLFSGVVKRVDKDVADSETVWPLLYWIEYEDGDDQHLTWKELQDVLQDPAAVQQRLNEVLAAGDASGSGKSASKSAVKQERQQQSEHRDAGENDENNIAAAGPAAAAPTRRRVLGEAMNEGQERRSKREGKRRVDADYEYEEARGAKRGPGATQQQEGAIRSRLGMRQLGQPGAAAELEVASESQVPYPVGDGGMRLTGLPGHLKEIEVINFMCHEHLKMEFANHVTFISGTNGSGKSAALQALQCCLGVKASNTGRANTFKKLIRTGTDEAIIRVTVWNRPYKGYDGFKHATFGDTITVERRISNVGTASSYALKDAAGRVHGRKRDDLDAMLHTLGLNAANPVCVMTQDTARNFLAGSSSKADQEKYQLYMEATSLDQIAYSLTQSKAQIRAMEETVAQFTESFEQMKAENQDLRRTIASLQGIEGWREEVAQTELALMWALVDEHAAGAARLLGTLEGELPQLLARAEAELQDARQEYEALKQAHDGKGQFMATYHERSAQLLAEVDGFKARAKEAVRAKRIAEAKIQRLREELADVQAQKETLENAAREVNDDVVQQTQAQVSAYQRELEDAQADDDVCRQEVAGKEAAFRAAEDARKVAYDRSQDALNLCHSTQDRINRLRREVQNIREAGRSKLAAFGGQPAMRLAGDIKNAVSAGQFGRPPIGPVGQHLTLEDSRWGLAVEAAISLHLNAYLVHTMADSQRLRALIKRNYAGQPMLPSVYVVNFDLPQHNVPPGAQPPPDMPTVYRLLACSDKRLAAPILNNLVDQAHIERIAVAQGRADAERAGWRTPNVVSCFTADGQRFYRRGSSQTSLPPPYWLRSARLGQSAAQQVTELEQELQQVLGELQRHQAALEAARQEVNEAGAQERAARQDLAGMKKKEYAARTMLTQLTQQPPPDMMAATQAEGEAVQAEIWQATQAYIGLDQQLREKVEALEHAQAAEREAHAGFEDRRAALRRLEDENDQFNSVYEQEAQQCQQAEERVRGVEQYAEQLLGKQGELQRRAQDKAAELELLEAEAAKLCSREEAAEARAAVESRLRSRGDLSEEQVAALLAPDLLHKKIKQLEKKIREHEQAAGGSLEELQDKFEASQARMARDGKRFKEAIDMYKVMEFAAKLRTRKLHELDHNLETLVNQRFRYYMFKKGHSGSIKLDRKERTLQLHVQMNTRGAGGARGGGSGEVRDLKQLSGGERSYTTVAFTLALGGQTEMPFRAMDEFDIFMDAINRRVAMQNLFSFAKDNPELQFIFLSPQDMAAVEDARQACQQANMEVPDGFVKVVQMRAPRANATRA